MFWRWLDMQSFIKKTTLFFCLVLFSCSHQNKIKEYTNRLEDIPCSIDKIDNRIYNINDNYSYEYDDKLRLFERGKLIFENEINGNLYINSKGQSLFEFADSFIYLVNNFENKDIYNIFSLDKSGNETCILSKNYENEESKYCALACDNTNKHIYLMNLDVFL